MSLKRLVAERIMNDILASVLKPGELKVLVMDQLSTSIVSCCCQKSEITSKGIAVMESLDKRREPLPTLEVVYIIWPCGESVTKVLMDFQGFQKLYKAAHVFLLDCLPPVLMRKLQVSSVKKVIKTLKECYIGFLPKESRVFTLNYPESFKLLFSPGMRDKREMMTRIADQLATLCATIGEFPAIRCHNAVDGMEDIAHNLYKRLEGFRKQSPSFATGDKSQLIILDRGFDVVSPLLHEQTYQAMVYDLFEIDDHDVYTYQSKTVDGADQTRKVVLDENDTVWVHLRHLLISDVREEIERGMKDLDNSKTKQEEPVSCDMSVKKLQQRVTNERRFQKEKRQWSPHINLMNNCDKKLREGVLELLKAEQDLATGCSESGIEPLLYNRSNRVYDKVRLLSLLLLFKKGMPSDDYTRLVLQSEIPHKERCGILNLACLGHSMLTDIKAEGTVVKGSRGKPSRKKEKVKGKRSLVSHWVPIIQDIMEFAIEGNLDDSYCPVLSQHPGSFSRSLTSSHPAPTATVRPRWNWVPSHQDVAKPRLILFVVGGITHSEIRAAYEVTRKFLTHDVLIGSTHIITPDDFIHQLQELENPYKWRM